jgi:hypothetical protein
MPVETDKLKQVADAIRTLAKKRVLVGVPMETSARAQTERLGEAVTGGTMSNASLGYVHEFGSPARNIPARPHLVPGVEKALDDIKQRLTLAARRALDGELEAAEQYLGQAGQVAVNSVQQMIRNKLSPPLAESTVQARRLRRPDIHYRVRMRIVELEQARRDAPRGRLDPQRAAELDALRAQHDLGNDIYLRAAQTAEDATPLLDTGDYMRAITWVIRDR